MLTDHERLLYFWELRTRIDHAQRAWGEAETALAARDTDAFWYRVDAFLGSTIGAVNLLWPSSNRKTAQRRAADLRTALGAGSNAPDGLREVRNGFEHFDERIDEWSRTSADHNFVDTFIGPDHMVPGLAPTDLARRFDPVSRELAVFGKSTSVDDVLSELEAVRRVVPARF